MGWKDYEKRIARRRKGRHLGGPGRSDYEKKGIKGEVKNWCRPLPKSALMREVHKGRNEIVSKCGFTKKALEYAKRYLPRIRLIHPRSGKKVVKRRRN